jgi:hypothetical protein
MSVLQTQDLECGDVGAEPIGGDGLGLHGLVAQEGTVKATK